MDAPFASAAIALKVSNVDCREPNTSNDRNRSASWAGTIVTLPFAVDVSPDESLTVISNVSVALALTSGAVKLTVVVSRSIKLTRWPRGLSPRPSQQRPVGVFTRLACQKNLRALAKRVVRTAVQHLYSRRRRHSRLRADTTSAGAAAAALQTRPSARNARGNCLFIYVVITSSLSFCVWPPTALYSDTRTRNEYRQ